MIATHQVYPGPSGLSGIRTNRIRARRHIKSLSFLFLRLLRPYLLARVYPVYPVLLREYLARNLLD